jgi:glutaredoxin
MEKIEIYTMETCAYCKTIKEELTKNNIEFKEKSTIEFKDDWSKIVDLTNLPTTPTIYYKNNYFIANRDFNSPQNLIELLKNFKESEFDLSRQNKEMLKTLNLNISMAFGRLDQLLRQIETKINKDEHKSTN